VSRESNELIGEDENVLNRSVKRVKSQLSEHFSGNRALCPSMDALGECIDYLQRQSSNFSDLTNGAPGSIGNNFRSDSCSGSPVFCVDILNHLLSPFMLKVDIDIRRFSTLFTDKARKKKVDLVRIHGGNAEAKAHHRISRGPSSLAEYAPTSREGNDVVAGEKVLLVLKFMDQRKLFFERVIHMVWNTLWITFLCSAAHLLL
jgi:hypothetical protein